MTTNRALTLILRHEMTGDDTCNANNFYTLLSLQMDRKFLESLRSDEQPANTRVTVLCKQGAVSLLNTSISEFKSVYPVVHQSGIQCFKRYSSSNCLFN